MPPQYASQTSVSVDKSIAEIRRTLGRYGAEKFAYAEGVGEAMVIFQANGRRVKFTLVMPDPNSIDFTQTPSGRARRDSEAAYKAWEQACRQRWRALNLVIKAKLEAVEAGITSFEAEFLANIMLPGGQTTGEFILPQIEKAYETGEMPKMLMEPE